MPTYEPSEISILSQKSFNPDSTLRMDTIQVIVRYRAIDSFGSKGEIKAYPKFIGQREVKH